MHESRPGRRVAIVAGVRTPFAKSGTVFRDVTAVALARHAARELLFRSEVDGREVDEVIFGQVVPSVLAPNVAREVSLLPQFLPSVPAYTLNRACASGAQAITNAADQIALGHADVDPRRRGRVAVRHPDPALAALQPGAGGREQGEELRRPARPPSARIRPRDLVPVTPAIAEPSTGETMGQSAEKMAKENGITREEQDELALHEPPARRRGHRGRTAHRGDRALVRRRGHGSGGRRATTASAPTPRSRRSPRSSRCSTGATAR